MKKEFLKRSAIFLLFFLVAGCLFISCSRPEGSREPDDTPRSEVPIYNYSIVRGDNSDNAVLKQVLVLKDAIESCFGKTPAVSTDWNALVEENTGEKDAFDHYEILVGITNRQESTEVNLELSGRYGYVCRTVGNKIVITASTTALL